jgi:hypothetical protein
MSLMFTGNANRLIFLMYNRSSLITCPSLDSSVNTLPSFLSNDSPLSAKGHLKGKSKPLNECVSWDMVF